MKAPVGYPLQRKQATLVVVSRVRVADVTYMAGSDAGSIRRLMA